MDTRKAIAVLALLAVEARPVRRDVLAGRLWPDATQERARASLRRTLSALRTAVGSEAIVADRETVELVLPPEAVDVLAFEALETADPAAAVERYRGPFLEGFSLADAADFEEWQRNRAEDYRHRVDGLLAALADRADPAEAAELARRRRALDPLNEAACRQAMTALAAAGDRSGAIAAYRELVGRLEAELGVDPLAETTAVYEAVRRGDHAQVPQRPCVRERPAVDAPSLVGRADELARLTGLLADHRLVLVSGEPGVGRSRLLSELVRTAGECLAIRCHVGEQTVPYAPFGPWLAGLAGRAAVGLFEDIASALPLPPGGVIVVDDLHLADPGTVALLTYLVHRHDRFGWSIVGAWGADTIGPGDGCWDLLAEGRREGWAAELMLARLDEADTRALIDAMGGAAARADEIVRLSEGLPLVVVESMHLDPEVPGLPPVVEDLMRTRLASVRPLARQVVEALAIIDRPAEQRLLQSVAGRTAPETAAAVEELVAAGIVREAGGSTQLAHRLLGVVAAGTLSESRRRALHERAGEALPAAEAADHLARAGHAGAAAARHVEAADEALATHAATSALHHLRSALALGHDDGTIQERIGDIEATLGHYDAARRVYEIAAARATGAELAAVELRLARLSLRAAEHELAASHLDSAEAELAAASAAAPAGLGVELAICRALVTSASGDDGRDTVEQAIELAQLADDPALEAEALGAAALVAHQRGDPAGATTNARRARRLARLGDAPLVEAAAANLLGLAHAAAGDADEAIASFEEALAILERRGDVHRLAAVHANLGDALHSAHRSEEARHHQLESARLFSEVSGSPLDGRADLWLLTAW